MVSRQLALIVFLSFLSLFLIAPYAMAQYGYMGPPAARFYSINGFNGGYNYSYPMVNRGYFPQRQFYPSNRPYTYHIDQYHHIEYNKPGRVGWPEAPKYYNAGPHPKSRGWSPKGR